MVVWTGLGVYMALRSCGEHMVDNPRLFLTKTNRFVVDSNKYVEQLHAVVSRHMDGSKTHIQKKSNLILIISGREMQLLQALEHDFAKTVKDAVNDILEESAVQSGTPLLSKMTAMIDKNPVKVRDKLERDSKMQQNKFCMV